MKAIQLSASVPQSLSSSVSQGSSPIQQYRAKQKMAELKKLYNQYGSESQQYIDALNAANAQFQYNSYWNVNPTEEEISKIQQRDYSQDEPFKLMQDNPSELRNRYESGFYNDYFKANPYAKELVDKWYTDIVINKESKDVQATLDAIQAKAAASKRYMKNGLDVSPLSTEYSNLKTQAAQQEQYRQDELSRVKTEEDTYYTGEQARLSKLWSDFDTSLGQANLGGSDFAEKAQNVNNFVTANESLITGSVKNYRKYQTLVAGVDDPTQYAMSFLDNPNYEKIIVGDKTIIREKPTQYDATKDFDRWQDVTYDRNGKPVYHTKSDTQYTYGTYSGHELVLQGNNLVEEKFTSPYSQEHISNPIYEHDDKALMTTRDILFQDNKLASKSMFGTYFDTEQYKMSYDWSGKERTGWDVEKLGHTYQSGFSDFIAGSGWTMSQPTGERTVDYNLPDKKPVYQAPSQPKYTVTASNKFGTARNILAPGEFEYQKPKSAPMIRQSMAQSTMPVFPGLNQPQVSKAVQQPVFMAGMQNYIIKQNKGITKGIKQPKNSPFMSYKDPFRL